MLNVKFLKGVRKKVLIGAILAFLALITAGIIAVQSLNKILGTVNSIALPNKSVELMHAILTDLNLTGNFNRKYSITNDPADLQKIEEIASQIVLKTDSLARLLKKNNTLSPQIDSLQLLVHDMVNDSEKLANAKSKANMNSVTTRLIKQLSHQMRSDSIIKRDSSYRVRTTVSDVRVSSFDRTNIDSLYKLSQQSKNPNFFKKLSWLFSKKTPSSLVDTMYVVPEKQIDTLKTVSTDSVVLMSNKDFINRLDTILDQITSEERRSIDLANQLELEVTNRNNKIIESARSLLISINKTTVNSTFRDINHAYAISQRFKNLILIIVVFFVLAGILLVYTVLVDLSKSSYYQQELLDAKKNAEQAAKSKLDFLAKMSHEIRSPLTSIIGFANLFRDKENDYIKSIKKSADQLLITANEILDLARIDSGIMEMKSEPFDLMEFFQYLALDYSLKAKNKNLKFTWNLPEIEYLIVKSDPYRLQQIITNLLNNALKFTENGYIKLSVKKQETTESKIFIKISIVDSGVGIKSEELNKIYDDYHQSGSTAMKKMGFGLGLGIVKKLVDMMNGYMNIESQPNKGTKINLRFGFEKGVPLSQKTEDYQLPGNLLKDRTILIADDDPFILKLISIILKKYGAGVLNADAEESALNVLSNNIQPDLCLLDIQLGGSSGLHLCQKIRENTNNTPIKIVAITANLIEHDEAYYRQAGFDDLILKPIVEKEFIQQIAKDLCIDMEQYKNSEHVKKNGWKLGQDQLEEIEKFAMGDKALLKDIIDEFLTETKNDFNQLEEALNSKDRPALRNIVHKLASRLGQFKFSTMSQNARQLEKQLVNDNDLPFRDFEIFIREGKKLFFSLEAEKLV